MQQFSRPQSAREIEARARARDKGVRVEVIEPARYYQTRSQSQPGLIYHIGRTTAGWTCTCPGFLYTGVCKHIAQVQRRAEREGWSFGRIAPRPLSIADGPYDPIIPDTINDKRARLGLAPITR